jgi:rSAM/selenodomain-associated transferase 1
MSRERLIIFLKVPRAGEVKTRLASTVGAEAACDAYRTILSHLLGGLAGIPEVELRHAPDDGAGSLHAFLRPGWTLAPQGNGDLGARLVRAFAESFASGAERVAIVGSDCPDVCEGDIQDAWRSLADADVVLGPASDGGYWLIGLRAPQAGLFDRIPWSTPQVLRTTMARAEGVGLQVALLRELADIDDEGGWNAFRARTL